MNQRPIKLTYDEIDKLLEVFDEDWSKDIKLKIVTDEELDTLLKVH
ncbi:hypothetical protein M670_03618 [Schinkia azotoformans MEV2011]|uniref:Uncharacterized protein n=1 Tax=Schinkia azotoformans MEV2011 TaxID=1348973 RepID=A0A072NI82_SCHAZ|nr:hypothetical protein [Schinkia azotoformans]KEF37196.1 hypothetical protein M670_03618 [Schinkia azotoformans MEV2011]MEC1637616.1 hypothetical protein [Schinkia azotoformans]MEC1695470.1 hypothetical protein [Schinkia azotoformans]MEC1715473.1 hypothetical protein [Schinkia azotoformans]MEC1718808.1 hypothetical protein [Schinkia azotoformans]